MTDLLFAAAYWALLFAAAGGIAVLGYALWLHFLEPLGDPRPLLDLYEDFDFDAPVPDGLPAYRRAA